MAAKRILKNPGKVDRTVYVRNINKEITRRFKDSGIPMFQELARYEDPLDLNFRHDGFVQTLIGTENVALYDEAVYGAIVSEAASLAKDALTESGVTYPGVWTDVVLHATGQSLLHRVTSTEGKRFLMVDSLSLEESRKSAPWPEAWTNNDAYSCPPDARMAYDEYTPDAMTAIITGLATAITGRVALLSISKYAPHVVFSSEGTLVQKYAKFVKERLGEAVNDWVYNVCDSDDSLHGQVKSFTAALIPQFVDMIASLAVTGGVSEALVKKVMTGASIAPNCDFDKYDNIEDSHLEIVYTLTSRNKNDKVEACAFKLTPVHILRVCCDKKPTVTATRMTGRMVKDALTCMINLCISCSTADAPEESKN